ncbi:hypothetical protein BESB_048840 [Besnoitia besnoiti]|uniref:Methyltransferase type 11 domain-containing protein n=1 Tax=Besnoitia besnoiti TaxID=94643 RepID=A0A2A9MMD7_BESBE|nr:hypothetical protein BESB_048840 [Besnoitia besnoiti]PFH36692.1 hypothetical protein BESB_048840 [Besnoitia besnoiti]
MEAPLHSASAEGSVSPLEAAACVDEQEARPARCYASREYWRRRFEKPEGFFEWYAGWNELRSVLLERVLPLASQQQRCVRDSRETCVGESPVPVQRTAAAHFCRPQPCRQRESDCGADPVSHGCGVQEPSRRSEGSSAAATPCPETGPNRRQTEVSMTIVPATEPRGGAHAPQRKGHDFLYWTKEARCAGRAPDSVQQRRPAGTGENVDSSGAAPPPLLGTTGTVWRPALTVMLGCGTSRLGLDLEARGGFPFVLNIDFCRRPLEQLRRCAASASVEPQNSCMRLHGRQPSSVRAFSGGFCLQSSSRERIRAEGSSSRSADDLSREPVEVTGGAAATNETSLSLSYGCTFEGESQARSRKGGGQLWLEADARALPLRTGSVDLVIDKGLLDAVSSRARAERLDTPAARRRVLQVLQETGRILGPTGCLLLVTHSSATTQAPDAASRARWASSSLSCALCTLYGLSQAAPEDACEAAETGGEGGARSFRSTGMDAKGGQGLGGPMGGRVECGNKAPDTAVEAGSGVQTGTEAASVATAQCRCGHYWEILREDRVALSPTVAAANILNVARANQLEKETRSFRVGNSRKGPAAERAPSDTTAGPKDREEAGHDGDEPGQGPETAIRVRLT